MPRHDHLLSDLVRIENLIRVIGLPREGAAVAFVPITPADYWSLVTVAKVANLTIRRASTKWKKKPPR